MDDELILEFAAESLEHMGDVEPLLLGMEQSAEASNEDLNHIFRAVHSIKGAAGFLGLESIQRLSHVSESLLMKLRDGDLDFEKGMVNTLLKVVDALRGMLEGLPGDEGDCPEELVRNICKLAEGESLEGDSGDKQASVQAKSPPEEPEELKPTYTAPGDLQYGQVATSMGFMNADQVGAVLLIQGVPGETRSFGAIASSHGILSADQVELVRAEQRTRMAIIAAEVAQNSGEGKQSSKQRTSDKRPETIRINVSLVDELMNLAGELVLGRNQLMQAMDNCEDTSLRRILQGVDHSTTRLQEHIMHTRMQPMRVLFDRVPRQVRDIASKLGKEVELTLVGKDVELDRSILEALADPLTHLVRNSLDHGIEDAAGRKAAGKSPKGQIVIRAYHEGGQIIVEIEDDGKGIDPNKLRDAARKRGLISDEKLDAMSDTEAAKLIFSPGLSTAEEVTDVSGRGVGMDVVRNNIQSLSGQIDLKTTIGSGTTIRIQLPLTLAIIPSLTVSIGRERFAIPQVNLAEVVRLSGSDLADRTEILCGAEVLRIRNQLLPLVRLDVSLSIERTESQSNSDVCNVVVLKAGSRRYGLLVDELHDNEEIVVKPLSQFVQGCSWYAGATILGSGHVVMILDAMGVLNRSQLRLEEIDEELLKRQNEQCEAEDGDKHTLLVFRNAETEHFAIGLDQLSRLERIESSSIETVGSREFIQHRGKSIPLIRLENFLPVNAADRNVERLFILIPRSDGPEAGIVATSIVDTLETTIVPETDGLTSPGIMGSAILADRMTLFLDTTELLYSAGVQITK